MWQRPANGPTCLALHISGSRKQKSPAGGRRASSDPQARCVYAAELAPMLSVFKNYNLT